MKTHRRSQFIKYLASREYVLLLLIIGAVNLIPLVFATDVEPKYAITNSINPLLVGCNAFLARLNDGILTSSLALLLSLVAYFLIILRSFAFFRQKTSIERALLGVFVMLTFAGLHSHSLFFEGSIFPVAFLLLSLYSMYSWIEKGHNSLPPITSVLWGCMASLSHSPWILLIPISTIILYMWIRGQRTLFILSSTLYYAVATLLITAIWYYWQLGSLCNYYLLPQWTLFGNLQSILIGLLPWCVLVLFIPWKQARTANQELRKTPYHIFGAVTAVVSLMFGINSSEEFQFLALVAYPFLGMLAAELLFYLAKSNRPQLVYFTWLLNILAACICLGLLLAFMGFATCSDLIGEQAKTLTVILNQYNGITVTMMLLIFLAMLTTVYQLYRKSYSKLAYANIFLVYICLLCMDLTVTLYSCLPTKPLIDFFSFL